MATENVKPNPEPDALFTQLAEPFDPSEIKWRVTHTNRDGNRGAVIAYADPRAYTDRLNQLFTPTGWTRSYQVSTVSSVTRMKRDKLIETGKVLVTCTLTITGLGCHTGSGEEWADEQNAMTTAEAQRLNGPRVVTAWDATCTTSPRCGCRSTNIASLWNSQSFRTGRCPKGVSPQRAILHLAHAPRRRNGGRSIRRQR